MNFIKWLKMDFNRTKEALELLLNRGVPMWAFVLYYVAWLPLLIWFVPLAYYFEVHYAPKILRRLLEEDEA